MQTFLPYESFERSAKSLDYRRLGKQRVEASQIYNIITGKDNNSRWKNHPAVKMWSGYLAYLAMYYNAMVTEWKHRGFTNNMQLINVFNNYDLTEIIKPWWLGKRNFHRAMRSRLIQKYPEYYLLQWPKDQAYNNCKYFWPDNEKKVFKII